MANFSTIKVNLRQAWKFLKEAAGELNRLLTQTAHFEADSAHQREESIFQPRGYEARRDR